MKKLVSFAMSLVMCFSITAESFAAGFTSTQEELVEASENTSFSSDISVQGTNSFGDMVADVISEAQAEEQQNNGFNIFSIEMAENVATVELEAFEDCTLIVAMYDDAGTALLMTETAEITEGTTTAELTFDAEAMPEYFYLRGFLADEATLRPKCTVYESPMYTQEMQEFLSKTTDDFDENLVLSLDGSKDNNFAVFSENTKQIEVSDTVNTLVSYDEATVTYVFENCDESMTSLSVGDVFAFTQDNDVVIEKIGSVVVDGTNVTIIADDIEIDDAFDFVKIESSDGITPVVDNSNLPDGMELISGQSEDKLLNIDKIDTVIPIPEYTYGINFSKLFGIDQIDGVDLLGSFSYSGSIKLKLYKTLTKDYFELGMNVDMSVGIELACELPSLTVQVPNCEFDLGFGFVLEVPIYCTLEGTISEKVTLETSTYFGITCIDGKFSTVFSSPELVTKLTTEISIFCGVGAGIKIYWLIDKAEICTCDTRIGLFITGTMTHYDSSVDVNNDPVVHTCQHCIDGDVEFGSESSKSFLHYSETKSSPKIKLADFYYSFDHNEFVFGVDCPYAKCQTYLYAYDKNGGILSDVEYAIYNADGTLFNGGTIYGANRLRTYIPNGKYTIEFKKDGYKPVTINYTVSSSAGSVSALMSVDTSKSDVGSWTEPSSTDINIYDGSIVFDVICLGSANSAAISSDGDLYTWGANYCGELGDGTTVDRYSPTKIMSNIKYVSLGGEHAAAITENGDLYIWGDNFSGQLGDGTCHNYSCNPIKIMSNVKSVALGSRHSAAITENGDLYTWGDNSDGQLGDGTEETRYTPQKIMSNIKEISLGHDYCAAVTENGDLYTWGWNYAGKLGDGTNNSSSTPIRIMENVKSVCLGNSHSAAITENGDLYIWGHNYSGELGIGNKVNCYTPNKIMSNVSMVSLGSSCQSGAVTSNGDLYMWGLNSSGQLGDGTTEDSYIPKKVMSNVKAVSLGSHGVAMTQNGDWYIWGKNHYGQLGLGKADADPHATPTLLKVYPSTTHAQSLDDRTTPATTPEPKSISYATLTPSTAHNFYVLKSNAAADILSPENILYITQAVSDEDGNLSLTFTPTENFDSAYVYLKSIEPITISETVIDELATYENGTEIFPEPNITYNSKPLRMGRDYTISGDIMESEAGTYTICIEGMGDFRGTIEAQWTIVAVDSIDLTAAPAKTEYNLGEELDLTGAVLTVTYADDTTADVELTADMLTGYDKSKGGKQTVTVTYCGKTAQFDVEVAVLKPAPTATAGVNSVTLEWQEVKGATKYYVYSRLNGKYTPQAIVTDTTYTVTGLVAGTEYGFVVRAYVDGVLTPFTSDDIVYATPVADSAPVPTKPVVTAEAGERSVSLTWNAVSGAAKYYVYSRLDGKYTGEAVVTDTSYTVTGLTAGVEYGFVVRAYIDGALTAFTDEDIVYAIPEAVTSRPVVTATAGECSVVLAWNAVDGAKSYYVYSRLDGKYTGQAVVTGTSYTVTGLTAGTEYGFVVRAYVGGVLTPFTAEDIAYATPKAASSVTPAKPVVTAAAGEGSVTLTWNAVEGAVSYYVYSRLDGKYTGQAVVTGTSCTVTGLTAGTEYGFVVRAYVDGKLTAFSNADIVYATPDEITSRPVVTAVAGEGSVTLTWNAVDGATKYYVYSRLNGVYTGHAVITDTSYTVTDLAAGTEYGFVVRAMVGGRLTAFTMADIVLCTPET